jgi:hypothetical protein
MNAPLKLPPLGGRWGASEGFSVVESWRSSGMSQAEFCRVNRLGLQRLRYWVERLDSVQRKATPPDFVVLPLPGASDASDQVTASRPDLIEIWVKDRVAVKVPVGAGRDVIADVLSAALAVEA